MTRNVQFIVGLAAILLVLGFCWTARNLRPSVPPRKLSALFIGMTNNVTRTMGPPRVEVCGGASGTFALFLVTNTTRHDFLWFKTAAVEKKPRQDGSHSFQPAFPGQGHKEDFGRQDTGAFLQWDGRPDFQPMRTGASN